MNLVLLAQDAFSFLVGWELMSLASWALVLSEHRSPENRHAALVYLIMASGGALTLLLAFGLLAGPEGGRSEEHTSELQSQSNLVCRLLLEKTTAMGCASFWSSSTT